MTSSDTGDAGSDGVRTTHGASPSPTSPAPTCSWSWGPTRTRRRARCSRAPTSWASDRIRERGGRTIVVDPRRTGTAESADEWLPIVPGMDAAFLLAIINVLDEEGLVNLGSLEDRVRGIATLSSTARRRGPVRTGRWHTRVRGAPEVLGQAPLSCLAEEIATPGEGQVRALVTMAGNPVLSAPDAGRLDEALWGFAVRSGVRWSPAIFPRDGRPHIADLTVRMSPWGDGYGERPGGLTLDALMNDHPHGVDFGPMTPRIDEVLRTASGDVELAHDNILGDLTRLKEHLARPPERLVMIGRRHVRSNNSWMHNVTVLVEGKPRCTLIVHPDDALDLGLEDGKGARVTSEAGSVEAVVEVSDEIRPGFVSLPHGWGHDRPGTRLAVAREHAGTNSNLLAPGHLIDVPSGNAAVNGIPVEVVPV